LHFLFTGNKQGLFRQDNHGTSIATAFRPWTKAADKGFSQKESKTPKFMA